MTLKIIGGAFRGRKLATLPDRQTRPTANRTREALFNILAFDIKNANVLDLFAGSGALGLEALSRGAAGVTLVEKDRKACEVIHKNIELCKMQARARLICGPVECFDGAGELYDVILMDPPYGLKLVDAALNSLAANNLPRADAIVAAEHEAGYIPEYNAKIFRLIQSRSYGKGALSFYQYIEVQS